MTYLTASPRRRQTRDQARSFDRLDRILATIPDHRQQPGRRDRAARVRDVVVDPGRARCGEPPPWWSQARRIPENSRRVLCRAASH